MTTDERLLTPQEAADLLHLHVNTVKRLLGSGVLQGYQLGTGNRVVWRITPKGIQDFLESRKFGHV